MKRTAVRRRIDTHVWTLLPLLLTLACAMGCDGDSSTPTSPTGPFRLTFSLDATFQGIHGGQPIAVAIVRASDASVVLQVSGAVSASQDPSFTWSTGPVMQNGVDYEVHYWIDSNLGGGTPGVCDPEAVDHQWRIEFQSVSNDINWITSHNQALIEAVCDTFS